MSTKKISRRAKRPAGLRYSDLSPGELEKIAEPFDREMVPDKPLTPAMRQQLRRAKRKRGRPIIGEGAQQVLVTIERRLLRDADAYAKQHNKNRSQLIVDALRNILQASERRRAS